MRTAVVSALIVACLFTAGCAVQQPVLPRGTDPRQLEEKVARKGQETGPLEPSPDPRALLMGKCLAITAKVGLTCAVISACALCGLAAASSGSSASVGDGVSGLLSAIWASD